MSGASKPSSEISVVNPDSEHCKAYRAVHMIILSGGRSFRLDDFIATAAKGDVGADVC